MGLFFAAVVTNHAVVTHTYATVHGFLQIVMNVMQNKNYSFAQQGLARICKSKKRKFQVKLFVVAANLLPHWLECAKLPLFVTAASDGASHLLPFPHNTSRLSHLSILPNSLILSYLHTAFSASSQWLHYVVERTLAPSDSQNFCFWLTKYHSRRGNFDLNQKFSFLVRDIPTWIVQKEIFGLARSERSLRNTIAAALQLETRAVEVFLN